MYSHSRRSQDSEHVLCHKLWCHACVDVGCESTGKISIARVRSRCSRHVCAAAMDPVPIRQQDTLWSEAHRGDAAAVDKALVMSAYRQIMRLHNVVPSCLLVFVGAVCAAHTWRVVFLPAVWAMAAVSAGITVSSVVVNDYFDFRQGVDSINAPDKPLPKYATNLVCKAMTIRRRQ